MTGSSDCKPFSRWTQSETVQAANADDDEDDGRKREAQETRDGARHDGAHWFFLKREARQGLERGERRLLKDQRREERAPPLMEAIDLGEEEEVARGASARDVVERGL
jgi:hypothetical protein